MARHVVCPGECSIALEKLSVLLLPSVRSGWLADWFAGSPRLPTLVWLFFPFLRWAIEARDHHFQFSISHFSWLLLNHNANLGVHATPRRHSHALGTRQPQALPPRCSPGLKCSSREYTADSLPHALRPLRECPPR